MNKKKLNYPIGTADLLFYPDGRIQAINHKFYNKKECEVCGKEAKENENCPYFEDEDNPNQPHIPKK